MPSATDVFEAHRATLHALAYRMLGSWSDAQDIAQDTYLRWSALPASDRDSIRSPAAWLNKAATRLSLDRLKSAQRQRETYVGPWLPEPIIDASINPATKADRDDSISLALMLALERLSPAERAAFLLRDVFHYSFDEVADILERSAAACRQLASRARAAVQSERQRFDFEPARHQQLIEAFLAAVDQGDSDALESLLTEDIAVYSDGGHTVRAARKILRTPEIVSRFFLGLARKHQKSGRALTLRFVQINGLPGVLFFAGDVLETALSLSVSNNRIHAIYQQRNPAKLGTLARALS